MHTLNINEIDGKIEVHHRRVICDRTKRNNESDAQVQGCKPVLLHFVNLIDLLTSLSHFPLAVGSWFPIVPPLSVQSIIKELPWYHCILYYRSIASLSIHQSDYEYLIIDLKCSRIACDYLSMYSYTKSPAHPNKFHC